MRNSENRRLDDKLLVRMTQEQRMEIEAAARAVGMSPASYVRRQLAGGGAQLGQAEADMSKEAGLPVTQTPRGANNRRKVSVPLKNAGALYGTIFAAVGVLEQGCRDIAGALKGSSADAGGQPTGGGSDPSSAAEERSSDTETGADPENGTADHWMDESTAAILKFRNDARSLVGEMKSEIGTIKGILARIEMANPHLQEGGPFFAEEAGNDTAMQGESR